MTLGGWATTALRRIAAAGALPTDTPEEQLRKSALVLSSLLITALSFVWIGTYAALGLWRSALIPLGYQVASVVGLAYFAKTKRYDVYRASQVLLILVLPFLLQWSHSEASSSRGRSRSGRSSRRSAPSSSTGPAQPSAGSRRSPPSSSSRR